MDPCNIDGATPLYAAAKNGHGPVVEHLILEAGAELDGGDDDVFVPLVGAAEAGHLEVAHFLLGLGAGIGPLRRAAAAGRVDKLGRFLAAGVDAYAAAGPAGTLLFCAARDGQIAVAERLLVHLVGRGAGKARKSHVVRLFGAALAGRTDETAALLRGTDVGGSSSGQAEPPDLLTSSVSSVSAPVGAAAAAANGVLLLFIAARNGVLEVVRGLIEAGVDRNQTDGKGAGLVYAAAAYGHLEVVKYLEEIGMDMEAGNSKSGRTPLHGAAVGGHAGVVKFLVWQNPSQAEFQRGDVDRATPLHLAAWKGHLEVVRFFVGSGSMVNQKDSFGRTALHFAAAKDLVENRAAKDSVARHLLGNGADIGLLSPELASRLLGRMGIAPFLVNPDHFRAAVNLMSVLAVVLASFAFFGWLNPPGGFISGLSLLDGAVCQAITAGGVSQAGVCGRFQRSLEAFFVLNSGTFCFSIATLIAALLLGSPSQISPFFEQAIIDRRKFWTMNVLLFISLTCGLGAFTSAAYVVIPNTKRYNWLPFVIALFSLLVVLAGGVYLGSLLYVQFRPPAPAKKQKVYSRELDGHIKVEVV